MNKGFWKNRNVLITGYEGFLGSALSKELARSGARVIGLDIKIKRKETILDSADYKRIKVVKGSVCNPGLLKKILARHQIQTVFHLAAEPIVASCSKNPLKAFDTNIRGTWNVLEACRLSRLPLSVIVASSDKAYGEHKHLPYKESFPLQGSYPYDVSKSCADMLAHTYAHTYGLCAAITRCGNIYGPGDFNFSRIIPDAVICGLKGKTLL